MSTAETETERAPFVAWPPSMRAQRDSATAEAAVYFVAKRYVMLCEAAMADPDLADGESAAAEEARNVRADLADAIAWAGYREDVARQNPI